MGMKKILLAIVFLVLWRIPVRAQQISGDWQGTLRLRSQELRLILQIAKGESSGWRATLLNMGRGRDAFAVKSVVLRDSDIRLDIEAVKATHEGKVSADAASIDGTWTQEGRTQPLKFNRAIRETVWQHTQYITVDKDVTLEVIDWGGSGRALILLSGLGNTAHVFDTLAPKLASACHVYGITRRGFGISSAPESGYTADRLGDDVLAVIDALKLDRPVLAGHSIAGAELSSVGSRHPEKVAGLIYLDAAYGHAFYDPAEGDFRIDLAYLQRKLEQLRKAETADAKRLIKELLNTELPQSERNLEKLLRYQGPIAPLPPALPRAASENVEPAEIYGSQNPSIGNLRGQQAGSFLADL